MAALAMGLQQRILQTHPQWWLGLMLLALHASLAWGITEWWSRALLLAHLGLFLIWQPVWRGERELSLGYAALLLGIGLVLIVWNNWWLMAVWLSILFGLIGGNVPGVQQRGQRTVSLAAAFYLLAMLLMWVVPHLFAVRDLEPMLVTMVRYGLMLVPAAIMLIKVERRRDLQPLAIDLFYSVMLFLLVAALVLGSFVVRELSSSNYPMALAQTLMGIAVLLVALSWLWSPHGGFGGLGPMLSRYLLSLGLPFERWMQNLAGTAERETDPERFLSRALEHMLELPWVAGVSWQTRSGAGEYGTKSGHPADLSRGDLELTVYARWSLSPALLLHLKLLAGLLAHFHEAKRREQMQRQNAYTQAIYETGARLTHDVKNLLQSLKSLCVAAESSDADQAAALQALMQRQLPQITQRLQSTLDKLKAPERADSTRVPAEGWWDAVRNRYPRSAISFSARDIAGLQVPADLFDSIGDNLIQNALNKGASQGTIAIEACLDAVAGAPRLRVSDNGGIVPDAIARQLFDAPVPSHTGLGIGLYQAARQARQSGYRLALVENQPGRVTFELAPA